MKFFAHRLKHWEYWPVQLVYFPTFIYWMWMALRFRSFVFYKRANPAIANGGLYEDSKYAIYQLLPKGTFPKTVLIPKQIKPDFAALMLEQGLKFPIVVKPDIGQRGVAVQRVMNMEELEIYFASQPRSILMQECIDWPNEMGLFFVRLPGETQGKITGITLKKFLSVTGNGSSSLAELLQANPRFAMQTEKLAKQMDLGEILAKGEERILVPYGNHNRGTEFMDGEDCINPQLNRFFSELLAPIKGFHYGRLDIRYKSLEELQEGKNFSIIELNGAKSEPTHIYDTRHNFWYGQQEIFRHQRLFSRVIALQLGS